MLVGYANKDTTMIRKQNTYIIPANGHWFVMNSRPGRLGITKNFTAMVAAHARRRAHNDIVDNLDASFVAPNLLKASKGVTIMLENG